MNNIKQLFFSLKVHLSKNPWKSEKGATAVEFAIILPVLVALLFGIIEFGTFMFNKQVITNASREGARLGIVSKVPRVSYDDIKARVDEYCMDHLITFGAANEPNTVTVPATPYNEKFGDDLKVTVSFNYDFLVLPLSQIPMKAVTIMRYE